MYIYTAIIPSYSCSAFVYFVCTYEYTNTYSRRWSCISAVRCWSKARHRLCSPCRSYSTLVKGLPGESNTLRPPFDRFPPFLSALFARRKQLTVFCSFKVVCSRVASPLFFSREKDQLRAFSPFRSRSYSTNYEFVLQIIPLLVSFSFFPFFFFFEGFPRALFSQRDLRTCDTLSTLMRNFGIINGWSRKSFELTSKL